MKMADCSPSPIKHIIELKENMQIALGIEIQFSFHRMGVLVQQLLNNGMCGVKCCPIVADTMIIATEGVILARKLKKVSSFTHPTAESSNK